MMQMRMTVEKHELNFSIMDDGRCLPRSYEILEQVGLGTIAEEIDKFYELLGNVEALQLIRWIMYVADLNESNARTKVLRYILLDGGIRMKYAQTDEIRSLEFTMLRDSLCCLMDDYVPTSDEIIGMLNHVGFNFYL